MESGASGRKEGSRCTMPSAWEIKMEIPDNNKVRSLLVSHPKSSSGISKKICFQRRVTKKEHIIMRYKHLSAGTLLLSLMTALCLPAHAGRTTTDLTQIGTSSIGLGGKAAKTLGKYRASLEVDSNFNKNANGTAPARVPYAHVPRPGGNAVTSSNPGFSGFSGITNLDQASAGTGAYAGTQFDLEPPDQALAVGSGEVVEAVTEAIAVYDPSGNLLSVPTPMKQFFGLAPEATTATPPVFGPFLSDPNAYFDTDTQRC